MQGDESNSRALTTLEKIVRAAGQAYDHEYTDVDEVYDYIQDTVFDGMNDHEYEDRIEAVAMTVIHMRSKIGADY